MHNLPAWQYRVVVLAHVLARDAGISVTAAVEKALAEEVKERPADLEAMRREMQTWLRENAIAQADGTWSIEAAVAKLPKE